jgi:hypothetical protein
MLHDFPHPYLEPCMSLRFCYVFESIQAVVCFPFEMLQLPQTLPALGIYLLNRSLSDLCLLVCILFIYY